MILNTLFMMVREVRVVRVVRVVEVVRLIRVIHHHGLEVSCIVLSFKFLKW